MLSPAPLYPPPSSLPPLHPPSPPLPGQTLPLPPPLPPCPSPPPTRSETVAENHLPHQSTSPPLPPAPRSETVAEKPAFRRLLPRRRCVVLMSGFYEWRQEGAVKQPYYVYLQQAEGR